jgi:hypothetical protein
LLKCFELGSTVVEHLSYHHKVRVQVKPLPLVPRDRLLKGFELGCIVVEHLSCHHKVSGLTPDTGTETGRKIAETF